MFGDDTTGGQVTTGTPIALHIDNVDAKSKDYEGIKDKFRPGHADYAYFMKYGVRDYRGGGRQSARETAARVAAGAIARKVLDHIVQGGVKIRGALIQVGAAQSGPQELGLGRGRAQSRSGRRTRRQRRCGRVISTNAARQARRAAR